MTPTLLYPDIWTAEPWEIPGDLSDVKPRTPLYTYKVDYTGKRHFMETEVLRVRGAYLMVLRDPKTMGFSQESYTRKTGFANDYGVSVPQGASRVLRKTPATDAAFQAHKDGSLRPRWTAAELEVFKAVDWCRMSYNLAVRILPIDKLMEAYREHQKQAEETRRERGW